MKQRSKIIIFATTVVAFTVAIIALFATSNFVSLRAGTGVEKTHTVIFDSSTVHASEYDNDEYKYWLTFTKEDAFEEADGTKYDLTSFAGDTSLMGPDGINTFGKDNKIVSFVSEQWEVFTVRFELHESADVDLDKSVIE